MKFLGVSVEKQVAILLHKLAKASDYSTISSMFGVHKSTVNKTLNKTLLAATKHVLRDFVYMPTLQDAEIIAKDFEEKCRIPQVIGAIQSFHVPVTYLSNNMKLLTNSKDYCSAIMQCVVDSNLLWVGWLGIITGQEFVKNWRKCLEFVNIK